MAEIRSAYLKKIFQDLSDQEISESNAKNNTILQLRNKFLELNLENQNKRSLLELTRCRMLSSTSLRKGAAPIARWQEANIYIERQISTSEPIDFKKIISLNSILTGESACLRDRDITSKYGSKYCPIDDLKDSLIYLEKILGDKSMPPVNKAATVRWIICSTHPFYDGNGRTANLVADWILMEQEILPMNFSSQADNLIALYQKSIFKKDRMNAIRNTFEALLRSYKLFGLTSTSIR